jgi:hypothetical protein
VRSLKLLVASLFALALLAPPASAEFGLNDIEVEFRAKDGSPATQAGSHPYEAQYSFDLNTVKERPVGGEDGTYIDGALRDLDILQPLGFAGDPAAVPRCLTVEFLEEECPDSSAVGYMTGEISSYGNIAPLPLNPVYLLEPAPGNAGKLGFWVAEVPIAVDLGLTESEPYRVLSTLRNTPGVVEVVSSDLTVWGNPADPDHDALRGDCALTLEADLCSADVPVRPLITLPRSCTGPLQTLFRATPWWTGNPLEPSAGGPGFEETASSQGMTGCEKLPFSPEISSVPTSDQASSPTGLTFTLQVKDEGLINPTGIAHSDIKKTVVALPEGMTLNPSIAAGLATCSLAQYEAEDIDSVPGEGCPEASKVGSLEVQTPLLGDEILRGSIFVAAQDDPERPGAENPFDTLLALYLVIRHPELGIVVKQAGRVDPDPETGQITTTFEDIAQVPFSELRVRLREGARSPLIGPDRCAPYTTTATLTPWARPSEQFVATSSFQINTGPGGSPCRPAPPFSPGFSAGSIDNTAAAYTPFFLRLTRGDGEQDITRFSSVLPPGLVGKLAGVAKCPDQAIAAASSRSGRAELASPSCPPDSQIGRTVAGAGAGGQLTYVGGKLFLAGPYKGAPLSVAAIVPAVAGPFDAGTVVVRVALNLDPVTAEVIADGSASDPIPHILKGIPLKVRDLRVHVDRERFILNPTSCDPHQVRATLWGGGINPFSTADDAPVALASRFQASDCARLGFKPRLAFKLRGGTKRGGHPAVRATFRPRADDANLARGSFRLPRAAFLDQGHIRTICTRVQFAADACPKGAIYGNVRAFTPLLEEPLTGPVYLRASDNELPDLVFDLHGLVDIETAARVDSFKGGIRITFPRIPDAPLTKVVVNMQGAKKGLVENSRDICADPSRVTARLQAHSAKKRTLAPLWRGRCGGGKAPKRR